MGVQGRRGGGHVGHVIAMYPRLLDTVVRQGDLGTLAVHVYDSKRVPGDVGGGHALTHAVDKEQEVSLKRLEHTHLVTLLQLVQVSAVVLIDTPTILK